MRRLWPEPEAEVEIDDLLDAIRPWEQDAGERPYVLTNFVVSVDGRATLEGRSGPLGGAADTAFLLGLRTRVDAVMIGAGTMRAERYGRLIADQGRRERRERIGLAHDPLLVLISATLDLPWDAGAFAAPGRILIHTTSGEALPETVATVRVVRHDRPVELAPVLRDLRAQRGIRSVLCEGGPRLHAALHDQGLVDELFVTTAPKLAGGEGPGLVAGLPERERELERVWLVLDEPSGDIFARYRVAPGPGTTAPTT